MKHFYSLFLILALPLTVISQRRGDTPGSMITGWRISTNIMSLYEPDAGPALAVEYRPDKSWSVLLEGAWICYDLKDVYDLRGEYTPMAKGLRLRPEVRYYLPGKKRKSYVFFFSQELMYKRVNFLEERIVPKGGNTSGNFDYEQLTAYKKTKQLFGTAGKFGFQRFVDRPHHVFIELYFGIGLKYRTSSYKEQPPASSYLEDNDKYSWEVRNDGWLLYTPLGFKVGYRF